MNKVLDKVAHETKKEYADERLDIEASPEEIEADILRRQEKPLTRKLHHKASDFEILKLPKMKSYYDKNGFFFSKTGYKIDHYIPQDNTEGL